MTLPGRILLRVTAVVGAVCIVLTIVGLTAGLRPLIFRSGSMGPDIPAGSLGFALDTKASDIKVGDVVTVPLPGGERVTHRVVAVTHHGDEATLRLKGDANERADENLYPVREVPRLWAAVPRLGSVVAWFSHAPGTYVIALYVALMLMLIFRRRPDQPAPTSSHRKGKGTPALSVLAVLLVGAGAVGAGARAVPTWAAWTDTATVSGTTLSTGTFASFAPTLVTCSVAGDRLTIVWSWPNALNLSNPTGGFIVRSTNNVPGTPATVAAGLRTWTSTSTFNNRSGQAWVVAVHNGVEYESLRLNYNYGPGNGGGNKTCTLP